MSLTVDGVWKAGVWATTVWANGVWREGVYTTSVVESSSGGFFFFPYRKRKRFEIEPEAEKVIERVVEAIAQPDTTREDLELALRLALQDQAILYRSLYLRVAIEILKQIKQEHEAAMEEEAAILLLLAS